MTWLFYALVNNWAYSKAQVVIANSNDTKADLKKFSTKSILKKIIVIGNPISIKTNAINKVNNKFISNNIKGSPIILSVGRLHLQKDYFLALKVFRKLINNIPDAKYVILGDGNLLHELKNYSNFLGLSEGVNIFFEGTTLEPENFYMQSDLFLMTSKWEGFGNVVVEAMGYGVTPVVCKCPGGPRDIIGTEYGYYVNSRDPEIIAISLEHALKNKISKDTLSKRAFDFRSNYIAEQYLAVLK